jgi:glutaredoxin/glutathione-dependent peroxiredoxin
MFKHVPGFAALADTFKEKGVSQIAVTAVNDAFVLYHWAKSMNLPTSKIALLSDGSAEFVKVNHAHFFFILNFKFMGRV